MSCVVDVRSWPRRADTVRNGTPAANISDAFKWRRSCNRTRPGTPAAFRAAPNPRVTHSGRNGRDPSASRENTNPDGGNVTPHTTARSDMRPRCASNTATVPASTVRRRPAGP